MIEIDYRELYFSLTREKSPIFMLLMRLSIMYEDLRSSAKADRKKSGKLTSNTLDRLVELKKFRKRLLSQDGIDPDFLRWFEKDYNNYSLTV